MKGTLFQSEKLAAAYGNVLVINDDLFSDDGKNTIVIHFLEHEIFITKR